MIFVDLRLNGATGTVYDGAVEIYLDGQWGFLCGDGWNQVASKVVCRQLGFEGNLHKHR